MVLITVVIVVACSIASSSTHHTRAPRVPIAQRPTMMLSMVVFDYNDSRHQSRGPWAAELRLRMYDNRIMFTNEKQYTNSWHGVHSFHWANEVICFRGFHCLGGVERDVDFYKVTGKIGPLDVGDVWQSEDGKQRVRLRCKAEIMTRPQLAIENNDGWVYV